MANGYTKNPMARSGGGQFNQTSRTDVSPQAATGGGQFLSRRQRGQTTRPSGLDIARNIARSQKGGEEPTDQEVAQVGQQLVGQAAKDDPDFIEQAKEKGAEDFKSMLPFLIMSGIGSIQRSQKERTDLDLSGVSNILNRAQQMQDERMGRARTKQEEYKKKQEQLEQERKERDPTTNAAKVHRSAAARKIRQMGGDPDNYNLDNFGQKSLSTLNSQLDTIMGEHGKSQRAQMEMETTLAEMRSEREEWEQEHRLEKERIESEEEVARKDRQAEDERQEKEREQQLEDEAREYLQERRKKIDPVISELQMIKQMQHLAAGGSTDTGPIAGQGLYNKLKQGIGAGGEDETRVALLRQLASQLDVNKMQQLPRISDTDLKVIQEARSSATMDEQTLQRSLGMLRAGLEREIEQFRFQEDYINTEETTRGMYEAQREQLGAGEEYVPYEDELTEPKGGEQGGQIPADALVNPDTGGYMMESDDGESKRWIPEEQIDAARAQGYTFVRRRGQQRQQQNQTNWRRYRTGN